MKYVISVLLIAFTITAFAQDGSFEIKTKKGKNISVDFNVKGLTDPNPWENRVIPIFMLVVGAGIVFVWMMELADGKYRDQGIFSNWKTDGGDPIWVHFLADFLTTGFLVAAAIGLLTQHLWGYRLSFISLGALCYTSINSLAWVLADKGRLKFGLPMIFALGGAITSLVILLN